MNVPGESASVVTCLDGYQMARKGRGARARHRRDRFVRGRERSACWSHAGGAADRKIRAFVQLAEYFALMCSGSDYISR